MSRRTSPAGIYPGHHPYAPMTRRVGALQAGLVFDEAHARTRFLDHCREIDYFGCRVYVQRYKREGFIIADVYHNPQQGAWRLWKPGPPPRVIYATCDTVGCVNPDHLIGSDWTCHAGHPRLREWSDVSLRNGSEYWACLLCLHARKDRDTCQRGHDLAEHARPKIGANGREFWVCGACIRIRSRERYAARAAEIQAKRKAARDARPAEEHEAELRERRRQYVEQRRARLVEAAAPGERKAS